MQPISYRGDIQMQGRFLFWELIFDIYQSFIECLQSYHVRAGEILLD